MKAFGKKIFQTVHEAWALELDEIRHNGAWNPYNALFGL